MLFDKFKGIQAEREVETREKSSLEHLIQVGGRAVKEYLHCMENEDGEGDDSAFAKMMHENYASVEKALEKVKFTEDDLRNYILAMSNKDVTNGKTTGLLSGAYGMYTSVLLELLTNRNHAEGKRTRFYVNGEGNRFDMLFGFARKIDGLYVENFTSDGISGMSGWLGNLNILIAKNIKGEALFGELAGYKGKVNLVIAKNIDGDGLLEMAGSTLEHDSNEGTSIGLIIAENVKSENCIKKVGKNSKIGMIIAKNIEGKEVLNDLAVDKGRIGVVAGINIKARFAICNAGWQEAKNGGQKYSANPEEMGWVRRLLYENVRAECAAPQLDSGFSQKYCKEMQPEEYAKQMQEYRINEILELVDSMEGKTPEEVFDIAETIQAVYETVREKVEDGL